MRAGLARALFRSACRGIELILCIGQYAQAYHLGPERRGSLTETVKAWRSILAGSAAPARVPLPHPSWRNSAWLKRNPWFEGELVPVLQAEYVGGSLGSE